MTLGTAFLLMCLIIYLSYVASKYLAKNSITMGISKYMQIIDRIPLGKDRYLLIVKIGEKIFFLGVTDQGVSSLSSLEEQDLIEKERPIMPAAQSFENFKQIFTDKLKNKNDRDNSDS